MKRTEPMKTIAHHISDEILTGYAAGVLPEAFDLAVASHLSLCDECRARAMALDSVGGAVLEDTEEVALSDSALDAVLARIGGAAPQPPAAQPGTVRRKDSVLPGPLAEYAGGGIDSVRWRPLGGGAMQAVLVRSEDGATARLLSIPGGTEIPDHSHDGLEMTLVLSGAFSDRGKRYGRGDVQIADETVDHTPIAEPGAACICLAVTEGRLKFSGLLPRLAQPFLRI
jgi:putative transcriptional regulator